LSRQKGFAAAGGHFDAERRQVFAQSVAAIDVEAKPHGFPGVHRGMFVIASCVFARHRLKIGMNLVNHAALVLF